MPLILGICGFSLTCYVGHHVYRYWVPLGYRDRVTATGSWDGALIAQSKGLHIAVTFYENRKSFSQNYWNWFTVYYFLYKVRKLSWTPMSQADLSVTVNWTGFTQFPADLITADDLPKDCFDRVDTAEVQRRRLESSLRDELYQPDHWFLEKGWSKLMLL